jgi:Mg-chelatase subunit ChlD
VNNEREKLILECSRQHYIDLTLVVVFLVSIVCSPQFAYAQSGAQFSDQSTRSNVRNVVVPLRVVLNTVGAEIDQTPGQPKQFYDDITSIPLHISTQESDQTFYVDIRLIAASVKGFRRNEKIKQSDLSRMQITGDASKALELNTRGGGFFTPGKYRVEINILGYEVVTLPFRIIQKHADAEILTASQFKPNGFNVALRAFGATIVEPVKSGEEKLAPVSLLSREPRKWEAINLIDGVGVTYQWQLGAIECRSCGWSVKASELPADIIIKLAGDENPLINSIILTPFYGIRGLSSGLPPKNIEFSISDTGETEDFRLISSTRMQQVDSEQIIQFPAVQGRFLRIRVLDAYDKSAYLSDIHVMEANDPGDSVLVNVPRNLASPDLGGVLAYYSSANQDLGKVVNGIADVTKFGWHSGTIKNEALFPQDLVFAFRDDRLAFVDRIEINPLNKDSALGGKQPETIWPHAVSIAVSSNTNPTKGFRELGQFIIEPTGTYQSFDVSQMARFVRVRVLSNNSDRKLVSLGEVRIIEGNPGEHDSILIDFPSDASATREEEASQALPVTNARSDPEPNDIPDQALQVVLDQPTSGLIEDLSDVDQYRINLTIDKPSTLNLKLSGFPNIKTAMSLFAPDDTLIREFDPGGKLSNSEQFSWHLTESGNYRFSLNQPPATVILVWDASGSMEGSTENLENAVSSFLDGLKPGERVNLIRFSGDKVEVLLPDFTADQQVLKMAIEGKFIADGGTPLYDALDKAMQLMAGVAGNRAVILLSDGLDSSSSGGMHADFWEMLKNNAQSQIHVIGLGIGIQMYSEKIGTSGERLLRHIAAATGGQVLFTQDSADLEDLYEKIGRQLRAPAAYEFVASVSEKTGSLIVDTQDKNVASSIIQPGQVALILDASGSMRRKLDGVSMIDTAKAVLNDVIDELSDKSLVSLRVFGHRVNEGQEGDCIDSEALVPFSPLDRGLVRDRLQSVSASGGTTLITYSLRKAIEDFGDVPGWKLVVLVTDGEEECEPEIENVLTIAQDAGIDMNLNIVGFALTEESLKQQLATLSASTGGRFFDANNADALRSELKQAIAVPYDVFDSGDVLVGSGLIGEEPIKLPEGRYTIKVHSASGIVEIPVVEIKADSKTTIGLTKTGDQIDFTVN